MSTPTPTPTPTRDEKVTALLEERTALYEQVYAGLEATATAGSTKYLPPERVRELLRERVAKTGKIRFTKKLPPMEVYDPDTGRYEPNEAYLLWTCMKHQGYGAYLPIDSLMLANSVFGRERYELFDDTARLLHKCHQAEANQ